ncbi:MAG: M48 family metalloprotease [Desulfobulbaceae bacterium]|uniref:M48 family metalloprotease n=1 Tax=Candidatus Desulfatifera sulfidica TaxID=2841691 RepID=A0A8J6N7S3_9BACT|nr:M48 family metalloprotease [Candidatus Desulfatifera sulfidica]
MFRLKRILVLILITAMLQFSWVQPVPAFSITEEREVGEQLLFQIRKAFSLFDEPDIAQYINDLGREVLEVAGIQYFDYHFYVINNKEFNAFAAPSGLIFFHSGLIETMNREDELVSVMAHEIGHIVSRHISSRMEKGAKVSAASLAVALAGVALGAGALSQALMIGSLATGEAVNLHFSRQDEEEADLLAYDWMKKLERNPEAQEEMLKTMRRIVRYRMGQIPQYLLTHPDPEARLDYVQSLLSLEDQSVKVKADAEDFRFIRMKYRMLSQFEDTHRYRALWGRQAADPEATDFSQMMATYGLALLNQGENNLSAAREKLADVAAFFPDQSILLVDQGVVELASGNTQRAHNLIKKAHDQDRQDLWALFQLARVHQTLGNQDQAAEMFLEVAAMLPDVPKVYFELGRIRAAQGRAGDAACYLGKYYLYEGRTKLARQNLKQALANKKTTQELKDEAESLLATLKRLEQ